MNARTLNLVTRVIVIGIMLGIIGMIQPWVFDLFRYGFILLLISTVAFIIISHVPERSSGADDLTGPEDSPAQLAPLDRSNIQTGGNP